MTQGRLTWEEIEEIYFQPKMTGSFFIINGNRIGQIGRFTKGVKADVKECDVLNELFRLWTKELKEKE
ncbi:MAG TPA: hypothetical protein PKW67_03090 [Syntrophomonadaceae bacterium]|nr:hypothetical protein [Syntrophomonadaceae bacterium]